MKTRRRLQVEPMESKTPPSSGLAGSGLAEKLTVSHATARPGEPIVLTATLTNVTDHDVTVADGPSRDGFVVSRGGKEVWRSGAGMMSAMFLVQKTLHPGESITTHATWDGQVAPGHDSGPTGTFHVTTRREPDGPGATVTIEPAHHPGKHGH